MLIPSYRKIESVEVASPTYSKGAQVCYNTWWHTSVVTHNSLKLTVTVKGIGDRNMGDQSNQGNTINPVIYLVGAGGECCIGTKQVISLDDEATPVDVITEYVRGGSPSDIYLKDAFGDKTEVWTFIVTPTSADACTVVVTGDKHAGSTWTATVSHTGVFSSVTAWLGWVTKAAQLRFKANHNAFEVGGIVNAVYTGATVAAV